MEATHESGEKGTEIKERSVNVRHGKVGDVMTGCPARIRCTELSPVMRYDVHGNRIVQINGPSDHEVYPTPDFVHLISPASGVTSTQIQITGFGERIARKKIQGPTLRTAWNTSPAFDPDVIGPVGGMALLGLLVWGARRGAFVLVVRRPGHAAASLAATLGLVVTPKVWAGGGGGPEIYWEIADPLGSGLLLIGENGLRAREFSFTPFGEPRNAVGGATSLRKNYAGHRYDEASGLVYMNARWYEPGSGRFMSVDPVLRTGAPQSHNAYSYVENNPIAANDPTGMCLRCFTDLWADTGWSMDIVTTTYSSNGANKPMTQIAQTTETVTNDGGDISILPGSVNASGENPTALGKAGSLHSVNEGFEDTPDGPSRKVDEGVLPEGWNYATYVPAVPDDTSDPAPDQTARNAAFLASAHSGFMPTSVVVGFQGLAFLGIGLFAIGAGLAVVGTGGLAVIPIGFYGASVTTSAGGAFILGTGFVAIGSANIFAADQLYQGGQ